jgi:serine/threonine protein kinase
MRDHASPQSHLSLENVDGRPSVGVDGHMISDGSIAVHWDESRGGGDSNASHNGLPQVRTMSSLGMSASVCATGGSTGVLEQPAVLGRGAFGTVYLIRGSNGRYSARKLLPLDARDAEAQGRTRAEVAIASRLRQTCSCDSALLEVQEIAVTPTHCVIDMEYMDAGHAGRLGALEEPALAALTRQLLAGLRALHEELRVIHRDLKPENVLLNRSGVVKIADFGVAALLADGESTAEDQVGTIMQMAPERLRGEPHGFASDIWSLGVTVAQLALGYHPFIVGAALSEGRERFWALAEVIKFTTLEECETATRTVIDNALSDLPLSAAAYDFIHRCTATNPERRPSLEELLAHSFVAAWSLEEATTVMASTIADRIAVGSGATREDCQVDVSISPSVTHSLPRA